MTMWKSLLSLSFISILASACGTQGYNDKVVKEYRLGVQSNEPQVKTLFGKLIEQYNNEAGVHAMTLVDDMAQANSPIILTTGLQKRDGKIGWGQWVKEVSEDHGVQVPGETTDRTTTFTMRVEFDDEYIRSRMNLDDQAKHYELYKLFAHEVGHGFLMNHDPEQNSVMYYEVSGTKDFGAYYARVRSFFQE